jgi:hypothetical protein
MAAGTPLAEICRIEGFPHPGTFRDWCDADEQLSRDVARARELGFDAIANDALNIANTPKEGETRKDTLDGIEITSADMLGHRKLQVETRLKLLACWDPKRYGQRSQVEVSGELNISERILAARKRSSSLV